MAVSRNHMFELDGDFQKDQKLGAYRNAVTPRRTSVTRSCCFVQNLRSGK